MLQKHCKEYVVPAITILQNLRFQVQQSDSSDSDSLKTSYCFSDPLFSSFHKEKVTGIDFSHAVTVLQKVSLCTDANLRNSVFVNVGQDCGPCCRFSDLHHLSYTPGKGFKVDEHFLHFLTTSLLSRVLRPDGKVLVSSLKALLEQNWDKKKVLELVNKVLHNTNADYPNAVKEEILAEVASTFSTLSVQNVG